MNVRLGAHMSIAGGLPRAVDRAVLHGCESLQIFTKSANQWRARVLPDEEIAQFRQKAERSGVAPIVAHTSYLINLASGDRGTRARSRRALGEELDRAEALGLLGVVLHPGCSTSGGTEAGLRRIADAVGHLLAERPGGRTLVILEHTAGQGTSVGHRFEHLATIIEHLDASPRIGVCLDTCHLLAAGYDLVSEGGYEETFRAFGRIVGFSRLTLFHLNDSKRPLGSRVDRHEHIGRGTIGVEAFRRLVNDGRFAGMPMVIETPKTEALQRGRIVLDPLDQVNLSVLRGLVQGPDVRPSS